MGKGRREMAFEGRRSEEIKGVNLWDNLWKNRLKKNDKSVK